MYPILHLRPELEKRFRNVQHPWVFTRALVEGDEYRAKLHGQKVVLFFEDRFFGVGVYNHASQIAVRIFSWKDEVIDQQFFERRIFSAAELRTLLVAKGGETTGYRLLFAESDSVPGCVIDWYDGIAVMQIHALAAEVCKKDIIAALNKVMQPHVVCEKSDGSARVKDGLSRQHTATYVGKLSDTMPKIVERGLPFSLDLSGQKTGHFTDQRENRRMVEQMVMQLRKQQSEVHVLNLCSYTGGFSLAAARGGATSIVSVDSDVSALELAEVNMNMLNVKSDHEQICEDVFHYVDTKKLSSFDMVVLDPPAFVKQIKQKDQGIKGYISLNQQVLKKMKKGSYLFTFSCSGAVSEEEFIHILNWAAHGAGRAIQMVHISGHAPDHPLLPNFPEARYLKGIMVRVIE